MTRAVCNECGAWFAEETIANHLLCDHGVDPCGEHSETVDCHSGKPEGRDLNEEARVGLLELR